MREWGQVRVAGSDHLPGNGVGLAPVTARALVESLRTVHQELGIAMLLVEQSPHLIADVVDRVYVLDRGSITIEGTVDDIGGIDGLAAVYLAREREADSKTSIG